jgi:hypothetical protein
MERSWLQLFVLCCILALAVNCAPFSQPAELPLGKRQNTLQDCSITGNPDFYGLGIRVGIYIQWATSFLANLFLREAIEENLGTNTIFLLALFVATAVATVQGTVQTVEILVLLQLSFGFIFSILSIWGHRTRAPQGEKQPIRFPLIPSHARLALTTALSSYAVWFWFFGYTILHARPSCSDYVFLFARVNASENATIFFKVQSTLILVAFGILFAREVLMVICFFCFVALWTPVIATVTVLFSAWGVQRHEEDTRRRNAMLDGHLAVEEMKRLKVKLTAVTLWRGLIQWLRISLAMF